MNGVSSGGATEVTGTGGHGPVFVLGSGADSDYREVDIQYLTISNGDHQTGTGVGGGVQVRRGAFLHLLGSVVTHNSALFGGGHDHAKSGAQWRGIYTDIGTRVTVGQTTVSENSVSQVHMHLGFVGGARAQSGRLSAGRWLASENRQLIVESTLVGGPRFATGDIGGEVRIFLQYPRSVQPAQHRHHQ